jgi:hypothetical protein
MENISSSEFLLGLEEYLKYLKEDSTADEIHSFAKCLQSDDKVVPLVKTFLQYLIPTLPDNLKDLSDLCHNFNKIDDINIDMYKTILLYMSKTLKSNNLEELGIETGKILRSMDQDDFEEFIVKTRLSKLDKQFPSDKIFRGIMSYSKLNFNQDQLQDAFSRSQIKSKIWLIEELENVRMKLNDPVYKHIAVMAGWFGQIKIIYDKKLTYRKMRILELDEQACQVSDYVFNLSELENYKVKSVNVDINNLTLHKNGYEWEVRNFRDETGYNEKFLPDLIINTSAEHMTEDWFFQIKFKDLESNPIVAIQSNNLFDIPEHVNCVHSVDHMKKKFPMKEILFEGELQLKGYKRVMLIGRP